MYLNNREENRINSLTLQILWKVHSTLTTDKIHLPQWAFPNIAVALSSRKKTIIFERNKCIQQVILHGFKYQVF